MFYRTDKIFRGKPRKPRRPRKPTKPTRASGPSPRIQPRGSLTTYRGIQYRSRWEVMVAVWLYHTNIGFDYEPQRFFLTATVSYLPDFYVNSLGVYLEVKGMLSLKDKIRLMLFSEQNRLCYLDNAALSQIWGKPAAGISKVDVINYNPSKEELERFKEFISDGRNYKMAAVI